MVFAPHTVATLVESDPSSWQIGECPSMPAASTLWLFYMCIVHVGHDVLDAQKWCDKSGGACHGEFAVDVAIQLVSQEWSR